MTRARRNPAATEGAARQTLFVSQEEGYLILRATEVSVVVDYYTEEGKWLGSVVLPQSGGLHDGRGWVLGGLVRLLSKV